MIKEAPENKAAERDANQAESIAARINRENREREAAKAEGKEAEPEGPTGPDGVFHVMQAEMLMAAKTKDAPENQEPLKPPVVHVMEVQMKGEALSDYIDEQPGIDNTLPEEPLPGKPVEPPLGGSSRTGDDRRGRR